MHYHGPFTDQHPDALRLSLVEGPVELKQLLAIDARTIRSGNLSVTATIIGASHVITFAQGEEPERNEVLACIELPGTSGRAVNEILDTPIRLRHGPFDYTFRAWCPTWTDAGKEPDELQELTGKARKSDTDSVQGFMVEFPSGGSCVTPKTVIVMEASACGGFVRIDTAHSYPSVPRTVLSTTTITSRTGDP